MVNSGDIYGRNETGKKEIELVWLSTKKHHAGFAFWRLRPITFPRFGAKSVRTFLSTLYS